MSCCTVWSRVFYIWQVVICPQVEVFPSPKLLEDLHDCQSWQEVLKKSKNDWRLVQIQKCHNTWSYFLLLLFLRSNGLCNLILTLILICKSYVGENLRTSETLFTLVLLSMYRKKCFLKSLLSLKKHTTSWQHIVVHNLLRWRLFKLDVFNYLLNAVRTRPLSHLWYTKLLKPTWWFVMGVALTSQIN